LARARHLAMALGQLVEHLELEPVGDPAVLTAAVLAAASVAWREHRPGVAFAIPDREVVRLLARPADANLAAPRIGAGTGGEPAPVDGLPTDVDGHDGGHDDLVAACVQRCARLDIDAAPLCGPHPEPAHHTP